MLQHYIKLTMIFLAVFCSLSLVSADNSTNSTYNITLSEEQWCLQNEVITFTVYNESEYDQRKQIRDDEERNFTDLSNADITVYDGPFDSSPVLLDGSINDSNQFSVTMDEAKSYRIEIRAGDGFKSFNDNYQPQDCPYYDGDSQSSNNSDSDANTDEGTGNSTDTSTNTSTTEMNTTSVNYSYMDGAVAIGLRETDLENKEALQVDEISNFMERDISQPDGVVRAVEIFSPGTSFSRLNVSFQNSSLENATILRYSQDFDEWSEVETTQKPNSTTFYTMTDSFGIFALSANTDTLNSSAEALGEDNSTMTGTGTSETELPGSSQDNGINFLMIGIIVGLLLFVIVGGGGQMYIHHVRKQQSQYGVQPSSKDSSGRETLANYQEIYDHTKSYVEQYSRQYTRDQIYRALKQANVPEDIIKKVFSEFYYSR